jgi:DHA2 family multidrug resistance protein
VALAAFVIRELTAPFPAVDLSLFRDKIFLSGTLVGAVMFAMLLSITFLLPVFMQELLGFTAMDSGLALMPRSLMMMVAMPIVGRLYNRVSPRLFVGFGILLFFVSAIQMSHYTLATSAAGIVGTLLIQGVAFACLFIPLTTVALSTIPRPKLADATGLNSLLRQIGGSIGLAIFASLIPRFTTQAMQGMAAHIVAGRPEVEQRIGMVRGLLMAHGSSAADATRESVRVLWGLTMRQATVLTFEKLFMLSGMLFLLVMPLLYFLRSPQHEARAAAEHVHVEM